MFSDFLRLFIEDFYQEFNELHDCLLEATIIFMTNIREFYSFQLYTPIGNFIWLLHSARKHIRVLVVIYL